MFKKCTMLLTVMLLLLPLTAVHADMPGDNVFCGDLSHSDCAILMQNAEVMDTLESFGFSMSMALGTSGDAADSNMSVSLTGSGSLSMDPTQVAAINAAVSDQSEDAMTALLETFVSGLAGDISLEMNTETAEETVHLTFHLRMRDGVLVFNAGAMEALMGESMEGMEWLGVDLNGGLADLLGEAGILPEMGADDGEMGDHDGEMDAGYDSSATIVRLPDGEVAGTAVAVFETSVDMNAMLSLLNIEELLLAETAEETADAGQVAAMIESVQVNELSSRQYIGLQDHFSHRLAVNMDAVFPGAMVGDGSGDVTFTMTLDIVLTAFNEPVVVEIPEDAVVFPLAMMMMMGS